jgi:GTP cyclohydrolase I
MSKHPFFDISKVPNKEDLPDPQQTHDVVGADVYIQKVGVNEVECPIKIVSKHGETIKLKGTFSSYVSLMPGKKGINMSRLPRTIYDHMLNKQSNIGVDGLKEIANDLVMRVGTSEAYIKVKFDYPVKQKSLLSTDEDGNPLWAWGYYPCEFEVKQTAGSVPKVFFSILFTYSSACPCSQTLSEFACDTYTEKAIPHSQRSTAKTTVEIDPNKDFWIEDMVDLHREALKTEVNYAPVMRPDEMHFATLNGVYPKFVEDAARIMYNALYPCNFLDFLVVCVHYESLHKESAISVIYKGVPGGLR